MKYNLNMHTIEGSLKMINSIRLQNKNKWVFGTIEYKNKFIQFKFYNTTIQRFKNFDLNLENGGYDQSVKQFKECFKKALGDI